MNNRTFALAAVAAALALAGGCTDRGPATPKTTMTTTTGAQSTQTAAAPSQVDTPIQATPATHAGAPVDPAAAAPATGKPDGAQDSKATDPTGTLDKNEESTKMPMAGQTDNHFSPSLNARPTNEDAPAAGTRPAQQ